MKVSHHGISRLRFGQFEVDLLEGKLFHRGAPVRIENQPFQILVALLERPGEIVEREELRNRLWPVGTYVDFDEGVNTAISKLRYALRDSSESPVFVETVPRRGYRFLAPLSNVTTIEPTPGNVNHAAEPATPKPEPKPAKPLWWKRGATVAAAACVVVAGVLYLWAAPRIEKQRRQSELERMSVVPLTALPGRVWAPSFSPDGSQVAFGWWGGNPNERGQLYVKVLGNDRPLRITDYKSGLFKAAWSPDGKNIAVKRSGHDSGIYLMSPLGGPERKIASANCPCWWGNQLSWSPDGKQLAFIDHPADSPTDNTARLFVVSLDSLATVPVKGDCDIVETPAFSPRGDYLAWACADKTSAVSIHLQRLSDGSDVQLLQGLDGVGGLAWSPDGRRVVYSTGFNGGDLWEVSLDRPTHPEKLPFGKDASEIDVSAAGKRLVFTQNRTNTNIWRVDLSDPQAKAQKVVASSRRQTSPNYSPDGTRIAFQSDRTGKNEIWVSDSNGSNAIQVSSFGFASTGTPRWSPDGKLIAFDSRVGGESNIYLVDPVGGLPRKLNVDVKGNSLPSWSHDGAWIYFVNGDEDHHPAVWKVPSGGGDAVQITQGAATSPVESPDGRYVYFSRDWWLWRVGTDGIGEQQVEGMPRLTLSGEAWSPFGSGIHFLGYIDHKPAVAFFDLNTKTVRPIYMLEKPLGDEWMGGLPVSSDGKWLLFAQVDEQSSDLMLVENWR
jgi:Tol biopolymer transport system component/DNA-binding winged helix-turn-helix (wHTH) protein